MFKKLCEWWGRICKVVFQPLRTWAHMYMCTPTHTSQGEEEREEGKGRKRRGEKDGKRERETEEGRREYLAGTGIRCQAWWPAFSPWNQFGVQWKQFLQHTCTHMRAHPHTHTPQACIHIHSLTRTYVPWYPYPPSATNPPKATQSIAAGSWCDPDCRRRHTEKHKSIHGRLSLVVMTATGRHPITSGWWNSQLMKNPHKFKSSKTNQCSWRTH